MTKIDKEIYRIVRQEVAKAATLQAGKISFNLSGRGHEQRVSLDRTMAGILRGCDLPRVTITGYGPNNFFLSA